MLAMLLLAAADARPEALPLPAELAREHPTMQRFGSARFVKWWMHVYDATLWTDGGRAPGDVTFALELRYAMPFSGADIAARSVEEIRRQGRYDEARLAAWSRAMEWIFPDVRPGDRLVGLALPGHEARFYDGRRLLGVVEDAAFVDAFFGIWLGERTSEPGLRRELLGGASR